RQFLAGTVSFLVESNRDVDQTTEGDTYAYVIMTSRTIHLAERFFGEGAPLARSATAYSQITVGPRILNDSQKVRVLSTNRRTRVSVPAMLGVSSASISKHATQACLISGPSSRRPITHTAMITLHSV